MQLPEQEAMAIIQAYQACLLSLLHEMPPTPEGAAPLMVLVLARDYAAQNPAAWQGAITALPDLPADIRDALLSLRAGTWFYLRNTPQHALFLDRTLQNAYAVHGLNTPVDKLVGKSGTMFIGGLMAYRDKYITDGLAVSVTPLDRQMREEANQVFSALVARGQLHLSPSTAGRYRPQLGD